MLIGSCTCDIAREERIHDPILAYFREEGTTEQFGELKIVNFWNEIERGRK